MPFKTISYGSQNVDPNTWPEASLDAMLRRGFAHFMGNEQASKVTAHFADKPDASDDVKAAYKADCQAAAIKALAEGTVGSNMRGPKGTAVETIQRDLAVKEIKAILKQNGLSMPTGDKKVKFGDGTELTQKELVERRLAKHGERLMAEAQKEIAAQERKAKQAGGVDALL